MNQEKIKFVFFGTSEVSSGTLEVLKNHGLVPSLIVCAEDKLKGRGLSLSAPSTKTWAETNQIPYLQPTSLKEVKIKERLEDEGADVFIVTDYDKIIPKNIFELPRHKTLNIHYSKLPRWRGASPIHSTILYDDEVWVSIMEIVEKLDQGAVVSTKKVAVPEWPMNFKVLRELLIREGAELLVEILPDWVNGRIVPQAQDESQVTYAKKIIKEDGLLDLKDSADKNLRKVLAYSTWPGAYFFFKKKSGEEVRILVKEAEIKEGEFKPTRVIPAGKKEMVWEDFLRGNA